MASTTHDADDPVLRRRNSFWKDVGRAKPGWVILAAVVALAGPHMIGEIRPWAGNGSGSTYVDSSYARTASHDWEARQATNRHTIDRLDTGTSRAFAMARLGAPDFVETYGDNVDVVFYRTSRVNDDGLTTKRTETTPIVFHDDVLVSHGRYQTGSPTRTVTDANWETAQYERAARIALLTLGAPLTVVRDDVGDPTFHDRIGDRVDILFYRTHRDSNDGRTSKLRETTPLVFIDGQLAAVGFRTPPNQNNPPVESAETLPDVPLTGELPAGDSL